MASFAHGAVRWLSTDAATTTYTVSGLSFQPKAIRFYWLGLDSASVDAASQTTSERRGIGFASSTSSRRCVGTFSLDNAAAADTDSIARNDAVAVTTDGAGAVTGLLDLNSITSDGFTLIVDDQVPNSITVFWEAWGGSDITNVTIGDIAEPAATGTQSYTATGFVTSPSISDQIVMFAGVQSTAAVNTGAVSDSGLMIGATSGTSSLNTFVVVGNSDEGSATMDTDGYNYLGDCLAMITVAGGNPSARARLNAWATDQFTLNWTARATTNRRNIYMAIKGGYWTASATSMNTNTLNDTITISGLPYAPVGISVVGCGRAGSAAGTSTANDLIALGSGSSTSSRRSQGILDENGTANAEINHTIEYDAVLAYPTAAGALGTAVDINAMNSDGFQLIVDTAGGVANEWISYIAFGNAITTTTSTSSSTSTSSTSTSQSTSTSSTSTSVSTSSTSQSTSTSSTSTSQSTSTSTSSTSQSTSTSSTSQSTSTSSTSTSQSTSTSSTSTSQSTSTSSTSQSTSTSSTSTSQSTSTSSTSQSTSTSSTSTSQSTSTSSTSTSQSTSTSSTSTSFSTSTSTSTSSTSTSISTSTSSTSTSQSTSTSSTSQSTSTSSTSTSQSTSTSSTSTSQSTSTSSTSQSTSTSSTSTSYSTSTSSTSTSVSTSSTSTSQSTSTSSTSTSQSTSTSSTSSSTSQSTSTSSTSTSFSTSSTSTSQSTSTSSTSTSISTSSTSTSTTTLPLFQTLTDNFNDNSVDAAKWSEFNAAYVDEINQQVEIAPAVGITSGLVTVNNYKLTGSYAYVEVPGVGSQSGGNYEIKYVIEKDGNNKYYFSLANDTLAAFIVTGGSSSSPGSTAYSATNHRWWKIRESSGTVYFDVSADGTSWNNLTSGSTGFNTDSMIARLWITRTTGGGSGTTIYDNFNTTPVATTTSTSSSTSTSSTSTSQSTSTSSTSTSQSTSTSSTSQSTSTSSTSTSQSTSTSSTSTSHSTSSTSTSISTSTSSTSTSTTTLPLTELYSRGDYVALPTDNINLENLFTYTEYIDVSTSDDIYVNQSATNQYSVFLYKKIHTNNIDVINISWEGQTDTSPATYNVILQIFNYISAEWETIDFDNSSSTDIDFNLQASITTSVSNYYDVNNMVSVRVYQGLSI